MTFIQAVQRAGELLRQQGRISLRALKLEFNLNDEQLEALVEELVDIQQVAAREGKALAWLGSTGQAEEAEAVAEPASAPEAERRQLTVLFCDLVDSTRLAAGMDAEDWRELVRDYQEAAAGVIERFEGHVAQYLGDGLLVYFGWPWAHEDDAERAVRAGLGILGAIGDRNEALEAEHGLRLALRIGIHTGPVVVGEMGSGGHRETLALGDTTNLAARLEGVAAPDTVVLSPATLRLVQGIFVTRDLGTRELKGVPGPVRVHEALRASEVRSRLDVAGPSGLTPLVGREPELGLLEERWRQVQEGRGQGVLVAGEAGIGKSRLVLAFQERLADSTHTWLECRTSPYARHSDFYPVLELHRRALGLRAEDPPARKLERIEAGLEAAGLDLEQAMPLVTRLHRLPLPERYAAREASPEALRTELLELLTDWVLRLGREQPVVLVMEDLHWIDPSTTELLGRILEWLPSVRVLLIATYRPEFEPPWKARLHVTPLLLSRLSRTELGDLIGHAARGRALPPAWVEEIARRSDGVPLFAEEFTKTALQSSPERPTELRIPATLRDALMARLDALGPAKELVQLAAVLGREFDSELLREVSGLAEEPLERALAVAVQGELLHPIGRPPQASYLFRHALIQDAAYHSLLRATRRRHHERVAEVLIARFPDVVESHPELVAHHYDAADCTEPAIDYCQRAGDAARARSSNWEAIAHLERGVALTRKLPDEVERQKRELDLQLSLGSARGFALSMAHQETGKAFERARVLAEPVGSPTQLEWALHGLASFHQNRAETNATLGVASQLFALAETSGDERTFLGAHNRTIQSYYLLGRFRECLEACRASMTLRLREDPYFRTIQAVQAFGPLSLWILGFPGQAVACCRQLLDEHGIDTDPITRATLELFGAVLSGLRREWEICERDARGVIGLAERYEIPVYLGGAKVLRAIAAARTGGQDTLGEAMEGVAGTAESGQHAFAPFLLSLLALVHREAGREADALAALDSALSISAQGQPFYDAELLRLKGELLLPKDEGEGETLLLRGLEVARGQEAKSFELRSATSLARLWQRQGKRAEARELLQPIYDWFTEGFDTQDLKDAKALLEELA